MNQSTLGDYRSTGVECDYCGREFDTQNGLNSHVGQVHDVDTHTIVECAWCGEDLERRRVRLERSENFFCGDTDCQQKWKSENWSGEGHPHWNGGSVTLECDWCGGEYERMPHAVEQSKYCSKECMYAAFPERDFQASGEEHPLWRGGTITQECAICGEDYEVKPSAADKRKTCSHECSGELHSQTHTGENHHAWKGGVSKSLTDTIRRFIGPSSWREKQEEYAGSGECELCGATPDELDRNLSLHHIIPLLSGGNHGDYNLLQVCEGCHRKVESYTNEFTESHLLAEYGGVE